MRLRCVYRAFEVVRLGAFEVRLRLRCASAFGMRLGAFEARDITVLTDLTIRTLIVCELLAYKVGMRTRH